MDDIKEFFTRFANANKVFNIQLIASFYAENFLFGQPQGAHMVPKTGFLNLLPKRKEYFQTTGLKSSKIHSLDIKELAENYKEVTLEWKMHFEKDNKKIDSIAKTTYILYKKNKSYEIIVQIDHQDLMEKVRELGLL
jgi:hypothetical protein